MIRGAALIKSLIWFGIIVLLAACGSEGKDKPLPTLFSPPTTIAPLLTADAVVVVPSHTPSPEPSLTAAPTVIPTVTLTETVTVTPSETPSPTITPSPTPTVLSADQIEATGIAQTNTAIAGVIPFTQTAVAVFGATATAIAGYSPTPSPTLTQTPPPEPFQVVFYTNRNGSDDLYLLNFNGAERALIRTAANEREPSCSPDGRLVVFASDASGRYQIYMMPLNSTTPVQLTNSAGMNFAPIFSPDGSQIAFVSTRADGVPTIWIMNLDGSGQQQITTELGRDTSPSWGPDGRQLLFSSDQLGSWDLFLTILGEEVEGEFPIMPPGVSMGNEVWPVFDSLGERIAYTSWDNLEDPQTANINLLDFELEDPVPVRVGPGADIAWAWGDDTHLLASVGGPGDVQIALVDITTREAVRLTNAGTFNGGARLCTVQPEILPAEPAPPPTATPTPTVTPTPPVTPTLTALSPELIAAQGHTHVVQPGDTLMGLGFRYGVNWSDLAVINTLANPDWLSVGQRLVIPFIRYVPRLATGPLPAELDGAQPAISFVRKEIVVTLSSQTIQAYESGRLVKTVTVSTGLPATPTVKGEFSIYAKRDSQTMSGPGYFLPDVPHVMYFYQSYGVHGTYWHDSFGQPMSHGCVNLPTEDAKWFYDWAEIGTPVLVKD